MSEIPDFSEIPLSSRYDPSQHDFATDNRGLGSLEDDENFIDEAAKGLYNVSFPAPNPDEEKS